MDDIDRFVEKEEDHLYQLLCSGVLTDAEYDAEINQLHREARAELEARAQQAYDDVMGGW